MSKSIILDTTKVQPIAERIQAKISEGSDVLSTGLARMQMEGILRDNQREGLNLMRQMNAADFMTDLTKALIAIWPQPPDCVFQEIEEHLQPLADIAALLNADDLNEFVQVRPPCALRDLRMTVKDFKEALARRLFPPAATQ